MINSLTTYTPSSLNSSGPVKENQSTASNQAGDTTAKNALQTRSVNLRNTTTRELESLFKQGIITLDDIPLIPEGTSINLYGDTKQQLELNRTHQFDVISHFENRLAFEQSIGAPTEHTLASLNRLLALEREGIPGLNVEA